MSPMVPNPEEYFKQFVPSRDALLLELEEEADREEIPIVGPVVGELLFLLAHWEGLLMLSLKTTQISKYCYLKV